MVLYCSKDTGFQGGPPEEFHIQHYKGPGGSWFLTHFIGGSRGIRFRMASQKEAKDYVEFNIFQKKASVTKTVYKMAAKWMFTSTQDPDGVLDDKERDGQISVEKTEITPRN